MENRNHQTLAVLILLTLGSYFLSEQSGLTTNIGWLMLFAVLKISLVAFYFMDLQKAHPGWWIILGFVLLVYAGFILALPA